MTPEELRRLAERAKALTVRMWERDERLPDTADFQAAFEHEIYGVDKKLGRRKTHRWQPSQ